MMRRRDVLAAAVAGVSLPTGAAAFDQPSASDRLAELLGQEIPALQARYNVPGVAVAILRKGAAPRILSFGVGNAETGEPVDSHTVFQVGSISKFATAITTFRLIDAGVLAFDAPVDRYLKRWRLPASPYDPDRVTARTVLSHSAGFSVHGYFPGSLYPGSIPDILDSVSGRTAPGEAVRITSAPGSRFSYSGGGYSVLQIALEDLTGQSFPGLTKRVLFDRLDLKRTSFSYAGVVRQGAARPHDQAGRVMPVRVFPNMAAGGLSTTVGELAVLMRAALAPAAGEAGVLSSTGSALLATPMAPADRSLQRPGLNQTMLAPETWPDPAAFRYGPGAGVASRADGRRVVGHGGSNAGWKANAQYCPDTGDGIVVLTNAETGNGVTLPVVSLWRQHLDALAGMTSPSGAGPEHAGAYISAVLARDGATAAATALGDIVAAPANRWFFSDRTVDEVVSGARAFASLRGEGPAKADGAADVLTSANARLAPKSAFAQAAYAVELARSGQWSLAEAAVARAEMIGDGDAAVQQLIEDVRRALARRKQD